MVQDKQLTWCRTKPMGYVHPQKKQNLKKKKAPFGGKKKRIKKQTLNKRLT